MMIGTSTGHSMHVQSTMEIQPTAGLESADNYSRFWIVRNWDENGSIFMYLGTGYKGAVNKKSERKQIVAWYRGKKMWSGYGMNIKDAIEGAIKDGWLYA
jgi:hypothetical protein